VTGAAGFIGSHLTDRLLALGAEVVAIDSFDPYYDRAVKERNLASARAQSGFRLIEGDLLTTDLASLMGPETVVFHLAAQPGVRGSWGQQFDRYVRNNVLGTQRLLEAAVQVRPVRVLYAGSSSAYGDQPPGPCSETARPNPLSPYGVTKLAGEHLARLYWNAHGVPVTILRFFTVYGPRQRPDMAFHRFVDRVQRGEAIPVFGDGKQLRDFTYVEDIVDGLLAAEGRGRAGEAYNLGGGQTTALSEVFGLLESISGGPVRTAPEAAPPGDARATWANIEKAKNELGYQPTVTLAAGLRRQWLWQTQESRAPSSS
jgi:nucleoside-diphosphate-sugar epimerase